MVDQFRDALIGALSPVVDGRKLIAARTYYVCTEDGATLDVGVVSIAFSPQMRDALAAAVREEAELAAEPHAESFSFVRDRPTRH